MELDISGSPHDNSDTVLDVRVPIHDTPALLSQQDAYSSLDERAGSNIENITEGSRNPSIPLGQSTVSVHIPSSQTYHRQRGDQLYEGLESGTEPPPPYEQARYDRLVEAGPPAGVPVSLLPPNGASGGFDGIHNNGAIDLSLDSQANPSGGGGLLYDVGDITIRLANLHLHQLPSHEGEAMDIDVEDRMDVDE